MGEICNKRRKEEEELEKRVNRKLEEVFKAEDARIQSVVKEVKENIDSEDPEEVKELTHWKRRSAGKPARTSTQRKKKSSVSSRSSTREKGI